MKSNFVISILFLFLFISCHPYDIRLRVKNINKKVIYISICKKSLEGRDAIISPFYKIKHNEIKRLPLEKGLTFEKLKEDQDSLTIIAVSNRDIELVKWQNGYYEYERILNEVRFEYLNYSIIDILNGKDLILYPNNGFKKKNVE